MHAVKSVTFNDGKEKCFALVAKENADGTLNLVYFPTTSAVEHANNIPEGDGGRTWSK